MAEKTVIQHLENIEEGIQRLGRDNKPYNFKKEIGIEFEELVERSTIYVGAKDKRGFNVEKFAAFKHNLILLFVGLVPLIAYFVLHYVFGFFKLSIIGIVSIVFPLLFTMLGIVYILTRNSKWPTKSLWKIKNRNYYVSDGKLKSYETTSFLGILVTVLKILGYCLFVAYFIFTIIELQAEEFRKMENLYLMIGVVVFEEFNLISTEFSFWVHDTFLLFDMGDYVVKDDCGIFERLDK